MRSVGIHFQHTEVGTASGSYMAKLQVVLHVHLFPFLSRSPMVDLQSHLLPSSASSRSPPHHLQFHVYHELAGVMSPYPPSLFLDLLPPHAHLSSLSWVLSRSAQVAGHTWSSGLSLGSRCWSDDSCCDCLSDSPHFFLCGFHLQGRLSVSLSLTSMLHHDALG